MTNFEYKPIILEGPAFRLLRVLKGCDDDPIQCQLFESKISSSEDISNYAALSYTWGSTSRPCDIVINNSRMTVTKNVYLALRNLRYREKDRVLWVDALSINQSDKNEQGQQVQQMGSIYSKAERVIIWLGEATYNTDYVMYYMGQLEEESVKHGSNDHHRQEISDKRLVDIWSAVVRDLRPDQKALLVEGLQSLLHRDWFKRVWVIQETGNARAADIVCGNKSVLASTFARMPSLLGITLDLHCQSIIDIMPGPLRDSSWWAKKRDLYIMLDKFRDSEATDPKDKIYALLGISSDACNTNLLRADYRKSLQDTIFDTASFLLNLNELDPPICCFFNWTLQEFFGNLHTLANKVLMCAKNTGQKAVVKLLLETGKVDVNSSDHDSQMLLLWASENGHEAVAKLLLEKGAEFETKDSDGRTPLSIAAGYGHEAVVKLLLEKGAEFETKDDGGQTPLSIAAGYGHEAVVKLLLEKGAEFETKGRNGWTPLYFAAWKGHEAVVKLLLEKGAEFETKDSDGQTPLSFAAEKGHEAVVKLLLEKGAEFETKVRYGWTPLSFAAHKGHEAVMKLLLEKGAEFETKDGDGWTPLYIAADKGHEAVVKLLLEKGAEFETKDRYGWTPLYIAADKGHEAVMKLLLEKGANKYP